MTHLCIILWILLQYILTDCLWNVSGQRFLFSSILACQSKTDMQWHSSSTESVLRLWLRNIEALTSMWSPFYAILITPGNMCALKWNSFFFIQLWNKGPQVATLTFKIWVEMCYSAAYKIDFDSFMCSDSQKPHSYEKIWTFSLHLSYNMLIFHRSSTCSSYYLVVCQIAHRSKFNYILQQYIFEA